MIFKAQLKVGWQPKYYIEYYIPKCWSYPEVYESVRIQWPLLVRAEKSKMASKMAARNKCKGVLYMICCTDLMYFNSNDIYFCCISSNFFMIPLNVVSIER